MKSTTTWKDVRNLLRSFSFGNLLKIFLVSSFSFSIELSFVFISNKYMSPLDTSLIGDLIVWTIYWFLIILLSSITVVPSLVALYGMYLHKTPTE